MNEWLNHEVLLSRYFYFYLSAIYERAIQFERRMLLQIIIIIIMYESMTSRPLVATLLFWCSPLLRQSYRWFSFAFIGIAIKFGVSSV